MKRSEFIRVIEGAMELIENKTPSPILGMCYSLIKSADKVGSKKGRIIANDLWWGVYEGSRFSIMDHAALVLLNVRDSDTLKEMRLNALAMYLAQSLAFGTYKEL